MQGVSVLYRGSSFLYVKEYSDNTRVFMFPSPIGEVVSYMMRTLTMQRSEQQLFPSPIGEVVSYMGEMRGTQ